MMKPWRTVLILVCLLLTAGCQKTEKAPEVKVSTPVGHDYFYVATNNALHVIDGATDTVTKVVPYNDYVIGGTFSPDGKRYYANTFHSILVFDTAAQSLVDTYKFSTDLSKVMVGAIGVSEDSQKLYISCYVVKKKQNVPKLNVMPPQLVVYDVASKRISRSYEIPYMVSTVLTLRGDPEHLILIAYDVLKFSLQDGKTELLETLFNPPKGKKPRNCLPAMTTASPRDHGICIYPYYEGEGLSVSSGYMMIDRNAGQVRMLSGKDLWMMYSGVLSPDKKFIYAVMDELIKIEAATGKTAAFAQTETGTCYGVVTSSDGRKVYVGPAGPDISVYDADTLKLIKIIPLEADGGYSLHRLTL